MSARSTRGPGGGKIHGRRPPVRRGGGRSGSPPSGSPGGGWLVCPFMIPVLPVLVPILLARHLVRRWRARPGRPLVLVAAALAVVSVSITLAPLGDRVWASQSMTSWVWHGPLMVALLLGAPILYLAVSLFVTRLAVSPAGPRDWGARLSRPGPAPEPVTVSALRGTAGSGATHTAYMARRGWAWRGQARRGLAWPGGAGNNKRPRT